MRSVFPITLAVLLAAATPARAAVDLKSYASKVEKTAPPRFLFRWVSPSNLSRSGMAEGAPLANLPRIDSDDYVRSVRDLLDLYGNRVAFSWIDPVLGSHGVLHEHYGGPNAVLVAFEINPEATAYRFVHSDGDEIPLRKSISVKELKSGQLVEHVTPTLHEWIIVNPKAIRAYTFDPKITFPLWQKFYRPFHLDPRYVPPLERIHFRGKKERLPIWGESDWSKSIFFGDQFFAFNSTPGHPWFGKVEPLQDWQKKSGANLKSGKRGNGDKKLLLREGCGALVQEEITAAQAAKWWENLRH
ncbi:MAG: hypothetical protein JST04_10690 [Bdellovibrionales bacterium]|nr:hypothetical protein [Bdellovibrionales bacterium]